MKMVKSLLLGSAAGLVAVAGAQAADLPVKAKAVEYVKVCSAYGAGYYYIPGTDTCLKIGGYARFDTYINAVGTFNPAISNIGAIAFNAPGGGVAGYPLSTTDSPDYLTRARAVFDMDARTATDYGVLRSYIRFGMNWDSQASAGSPAGSGLYFERAFIQFAGFTFGYTQSFFDTGINYALTTLYAGSYQWTTVLGYTAQFGNGFSATLALEDAANRITGIQYNSASFTNAGGGYTSYQDGQSAPDIVANLRLDQAWGTAMLSGALHQVAAMTPTAVPGVAYVGQSSTDSWGWALGGSVEFKLPMLSPGDSLYIQANYADGALSYLGLSGTSQGRATALGSISVGGVANAISGAYYPLADAIWTGTGFSKESGWAIQAQYRHFWTPGIRSAVFGGYVSVDVPYNTLNAYSTQMWQVGANTIWSPVKNLDLGVEVLYSKVDGDSPLYARGGNASTVPTTIAGGSTDVWSGGIRAQRNF
ncbi:porin [Aquabacter sediminis]|uniref:porin n=1 Tax=Aquabacter sediminis TaxID=3029197 RepID=UPI00237E6763|nr:porin [Aquabacter sp. P-9]MDE1567564.1 porin [Aquabacter sp. P-9]